MDTHHLTNKLFITTAISPFYIGLDSKDRFIKISTQQISIFTETLDL